MGIEIKNLEFQYEKFKLKIENLEIKKGKFHTLVGESGCGKTTLLRLIAGLEEVKIGEIIVNRDEIGYIFQEPLLLPHLTVIENVCFGLKMKKINKKKRIEIGRKYLKELKIEDLEHRYPDEISGGQGQRVAIARALVLEPKVLLMDEPFSALDENLRENLRILIREIHDNRKMTSILVTHDLNEAFFVSDTISIMKSGNILQTGNVETILKKPKNSKVAKFLGYKNLFKCKVKNKEMTIVDAEYKQNIDKKDGEYNVLFFPEDIILANEDKKMNLVGQIENQRRLLYGYTLDLKSKNTKWQVFVSGENNEYQLGKIENWHCDASKIYFFEEDNHERL